MQDDLGRNYTYKNWLAAIREGEPDAATSTAKTGMKWKAFVWLGVAWIVFGLIQVYDFREGLLEWISRGNSGKPLSLMDGVVDTRRSPPVKSRSFLSVPKLMGCRGV